MSKVERKPSRQYIDLLLELKREGISLSKEQEIVLREAGYLEPQESNQKDSQEEEVENQHVEVSIDFSRRLSDKDKKKLIKIRETVEIKDSDWKPKSINEHTKEFIDWITAITLKGFQSRTFYEPFEFYHEQARRWLNEKTEVDFTDHEERMEYYQEEIYRCDVNTLYFLNKYLKLKEGDMESGSRQYDAKPVHEVIAYLFDCGYSMYIAKPRQIAATSTLGGCAVKKLITKPNFFLKFISESDDKTEEIFGDKIKYPFEQLPHWMKPEVLNDRGNMIVLAKKVAKGNREGVNSKLLVQGPSKTAVAGGSPQLVMIDEAGNIGILSRMIEDARPTMYWQDPVTKKLTLKRQIIAWGTGGDMEKGGRAFETEFKSALKQWQEGKYSTGIIPIFFDWTTRPGITQEFYDQQKDEFYSKTGPEAEKSKIQFHQQYPSTLEDVFMLQTKTLVDQGYITQQINRIRKSNEDMRCAYGYFIPVYDTTKPLGDESDTPYEITGAEFVRTEVTNPMVSTIMFMPPKQGWEDRYYQGTDPINNNTGISNLASAIWDAEYNTVSCVVNFRSNNYKEAYLQALLMGIYYQANKAHKGVKHLIEANIGLTLVAYIEQKKMFNTLVFNTELPDVLQAGSVNLVGIDNRTKRTPLIINKMFEIFQAYGDRLWIEDIYIQLQTFTSEITDKGNITWGPIDPKIHRDDILFAITFAYICALSFPTIKPKKKEQLSQVVRTIKYETTYDKNYNLVRVPKRIVKR